ncbi:MAG TPA: hypothetical protein VK074_00485, partial [Fodinibius sp.]|nr:hypothetical protein [Fodinibius sp.]
MSIRYTALLIAGILMTMTACDLTELPQDTASKENVFNDEIGLELYANSFYNILPGATTITQGDAMADYSARR